MILFPELRIPASAADTADDDPNGINTFLANCVVHFSLIVYNPHNCIILEIYVFHM